MKKTGPTRVSYRIPEWAAGAIRPLIRRGPDRDRLLAHLAVAAGDALERPRTLLAEFEALYGRYARRGRPTHVRIRLPRSLAARLAEVEASGIRPWIVLVVAASRMAAARTEAAQKEGTPDLPGVRPGGEFATEDEP
jgi:hypothetical protein